MQKATKYSAGCIKSVKNESDDSNSSRMAFCDIKKMLGLAFLV